ncbi:MAG: putative porin [Desulfobacterales bacterium]
MKRACIFITAASVFVLAISLFCASPSKAKAVDLPEWISNMKFKGDVRVRYQDEERDPIDEGGENSRFRVRWRAGFETQINDYWSAGFGLASGGDDPRSTNQTLEDTFETGDARLNYAYAEFHTGPVSVLAGKFKNPIWNPKDLLWDSDITTDGVAAVFDFDAAENTSLFFTPAVFVLDEWKDTETEDLPTMLALQAGVKLDFAMPGYITFAGTYYANNNIEGNDWSEHSAETNTTDIDGNWEYDHDAYSLEAEVGLTGLPVFVAAFGQYVTADVDDEDTGYLYGVKFGRKKVKNFMDWQVKVNYRHLEQNAWLDFLPDSDFLGGATNVEGMEYEFVLGLAKNVSLGLDYYQSEVIKGSIDGVEEENLLQVDLVVKF